MKFLVKKCLFQKNHDFSLKLNLKLDEKFIILYRKDKIYQLESYFRFDIFRKDTFNSNINYKDENTFNNLIRFIKKKSTYYDDFVNKYIKSNKYKQSLIIENIVNTFEKIEYKNNLDNEIYKKINKEITPLDI